MGYNIYNIQLDYICVHLYIKIDGRNGSMDSPKEQISGSKDHIKNFSQEVAENVIYKMQAKRYEAVKQKC